MGEKTDLKALLCKIGQPLVVKIHPVGMTDVLDSVGEAAGASISSLDLLLL